MRRNLLSLAALISLYACDHSPPGSPAPAASLPEVAAVASSHPDAQAFACSATYSVSAVIEGSWFGDAADARPPPALVVQLDDATLGPPSSREIARVSLALPFFAADVKLRDLCSDVGAAGLDVQCVTGARLSRIIVRPAGDGLDASIDGAPAQHWTMPNGAPGACFALHGLGEHHELEATRAAWGRDVPSDRCGNKPRTLPVHVAVDFLPPPTPTPCAPGTKASNTNEVVVSTSGWKKSLGVLSNLCGGLHPLRWSDADALRLDTSDMGSEDRDVYRLGDRLYVVEGGDHITSTDLPCGARISFDVHYPHRDLLIEQVRRPIRD